MSDFLKPLIVCENPALEMTKLNLYKDKEQQIEKVYNQAPTEEEVSDLKQKIQNSSIKLQNDIYDPNNGNTGYTWSQEDDLISIKYTAKYPLREQDVDISLESIDMQFLSGKWYGEILQFDYKITGYKIQIDIQVKDSNEKWPVLICGGNMDLDSMYYLGTFAEALKDSALARKFFYSAALRSHQRSMSILFNDAFEDHPLISLYWSIREAAEYNSGTALFKSAILLTGFSADPGVDEGAAALAEAAFIKLATEGVEPAFYQLGALHLGNHPGFPTDTGLGIKYLKFAVSNFRNPQALELLGKCYLNGIGVPQDTNTGQELLKAANQIFEGYHMNVESEEDNEEKPESTENVEKEEEPEVAEEKNKDKIINGLIAFGIVAVAIGLTGYTVRKVFKRK